MSIQASPGDRRWRLEYGFLPIVEVRRVEDRELVGLVLSGDASAAELLVQRHRYMVMRVLRRFRALTPADIDDLFQEVFGRLFDNGCAALESWHGGNDLAAYVRRIATNLVLDHLRSRRRILDDQFLEDPDAVAGDAEDPETAALLNQLRRMMLEAIQQLAPPQAEVIRLVDLAELSYAEAADRLEITRNNLGVRLHNARASLARLIADRYPALMAYLRDVD
jgi:RNA polymerase sigma-70 factor (ECF subfamily)